MIDDVTPLNTPIPTIPILTDIISRGAKAPPIDDVDRFLTDADEDTDTPASPYDVSSESPTVFPERQPKTDIPAEPEKVFSLDELTDIPIPADDEASNNEDINEIIAQAMPLLMSEMEKLARETLKEILESKTSEQEDRPDD